MWKQVWGGGGEGASSCLLAVGTCLNCQTRLLRFLFRISNIKAWHAKQKLFIIKQDSEDDSPSCLLKNNLGAEGVQHNDVIIIFGIMEDLISSPLNRKSLLLSAS